jgi:hypothetical protein
MVTIDKYEATPQLLLVIDHREAQVYRLGFHGAVPERIIPYDPYGNGQYLHSADEWTDGKRRPERKRFYEAVAKTLQAAGQILVLGSGIGRSYAMEQLLADLKDHHPDVSKKIVGSVLVDVHELSANRLLPQAQAFYAEYNQKQTEHANVAI